MGLLLQLLANGIVHAGLYAMLAVGFGLILRTMRVFHVAYGAHFVMVAYLLYVFVELLGQPLWFALLLSLSGSALAGYLIEKLLFKPFFQREAGPSVMLIVSLGLAIILENVIAIIFGNEFKSISRGIAPSYHIGAIVLTGIQILQFAVGFLVTAVLWLLTKRVNVFKAIWALGDEPGLVPVIGLPLWRLRTIVMVLSAICVALPASLIALDVGMDPHMGTTYLLIAAVAVIAGGVDRFSGWIAGSMVLAVLQSIAIWKISSRWVDLVTFLFLITMLMAHPQGILGPQRRLEETP